MLLRQHAASQRSMNEGSGAPNIDQADICFIRKQRLNCENVQRRCMLGATGLDERRAAKPARIDWNSFDCLDNFIGMTKPCMSKEQRCCFGRVWKENVHSNDVTSKLDLDA